MLRWLLWASTGNPSAPTKSAAATNLRGCVDDTSAFDSPAADMPRTQLSGTIGALPQLEMGRETPIQYANHYFIDPLLATNG